MTLKAIAKRWLPPALLDRLKPALRQGVYFSGPYADWASAARASGGYDAAPILARVEQATAKVQRGEAAYERDSVTFAQMRHPYAVLVGLLRAAAESGGRLSVLDFGGALGSSYFQCRDFLAPLPDLSWGVVEQSHFVRCGRERFESGALRFHAGIDECVRAAAPNVALLSSVLQYLPAPAETLDALMDAGIRHLVIDRTPFCERELDVICVQHVPPSIYAASYPCRIFAREPFFARLLARYKLLTQFDGDVDGSGRVGRLQFGFGGVVLRRR